LVESNSLKSKKIRKFDLIVVGSGAGLEVASAAAQSGMKVELLKRAEWVEPA